MMELGGDTSQGNFIKSVLDVLSGNYEASNSSLFEIFSND